MSNFWMFFEEELLPTVEKIGGQMLIHQLGSGVRPTYTTEAEVAAFSMLTHATALHNAGHAVTLKSVAADDAATLASIVAHSSESPVAQIAAKVITDAGASEQAGEAGGAATTLGTAAEDAVVEGLGGSMAGQVEGAVQENTPTE